MNFVSKVEEKIRNEFAAGKLQHAYTVRENALRIAGEMKVDLEAIEIAALMHDSGTTSMQSSLKAIKLLSEIEYNEEKKHKIAKLIHNHPFDSFLTEQRILFEADKNQHKKTFFDKIKSFFR